MNKIIQQLKDNDLLRIIDDHLDIYLEIWINIQNF